MGSVEVAQLIYGNVEKELSPTGRGGFQTLFYSRAALTEAEAEEVEARLVYFPAATAPVKRLLFTTTAGKFVVAQIVSLSEPDRSGRLGRYLGHALVVPSNCLDGAEIFGVFAAFPFVTSVEDALARGDFASGDVPLATWTSPPTSSTKALASAAQWLPDDLGRLAKLAIGADTLAQDRSLLAVVGLPDEIEQVLQTALLFVPAALVPKCSFDTWFHRCNPAAVRYWAVGLPEPPTGPQYIVLDAHRRRLTSALPALPTTCYQNWIAASIGHQELGWIARHRESAFALCQWLDGQQKEPPAIGQLPPELVGSVMGANASTVRTRLQTKLDVQLSPVLTRHVLERLYTHSGPQDLVRGLHQGFDRGQLLAMLYEHYLSMRFAVPAAAERRALEAILASAEPCRLHLLHAAWSRAPSQLRQQLSSLTDVEYREFAEAASRWQLVDPLWLLISQRGSLFLDVYLASCHPSEVDLPNLVWRLIEIDQCTCLSRLVSLVELQSHRALRQVAGFVAQRRDIPEAFRQVVEAALARQPERRGLMASLRALLGRTSPEETPPPSPHEAIKE